MTRCAYGTTCYYMSYPDLNTRQVKEYNNAKEWTLERNLVGLECFDISFVGHGHIPASPGLVPAVKYDLHNLQC